MRPYLGKIMLSMIAMAGVGLMTGASAWLIKPAMDKIFIAKDETMIYLIPIAIITVFVLKGIFRYSQGYLMKYTEEHVVMKIREELVEHLHKLPMSFSEKWKTGELMSRVTNDINKLQSSISTFATLVLQIFNIIALIAVVILQNWKLGIIATIVLPVAVIPIVHFGKKLRRVGRKTQESVADMMNILQEEISGIKTIQAFLKEKTMLERFKRINRRYYDVTMKAARSSLISSPITEAIGAVGLAIVIWMGGKEVINGTMTPGAFSSFIAASMMLYDPAKRLTNANNSIQQGLAAAERVFFIMDIKPEIENKANSVTLRNNPELIEFSHTYMKYNKEERYVLKDLSFSVKKGQKVAIVGPTGAGKTSMADLMLRFYDPEKGSVLFDHKDIRSFTLESLRDKISIVTQDIFLFNDTIANNISFGNNEITFEAIKQVALAAYADRFIERLPEKYNTLIGDRGTRLSGGERQRISIARAILKNSPILILDEATSALDSMAEEIVQRAIDNLMKNRTVFIIAHRLSTIRNADFIVVLNDGKIEAIGKHNALLERSVLYKRLHELQVNAKNSC